MSVLGVCLLNGRPHGKLRQPVHGGQTALQLRRHGGRSRGSGEEWHEGGGEGVAIWCGENAGVPSDQCFVVVTQNGTCREEQERVSLYCPILSAYQRSPLKRAGAFVVRTTSAGTDVILISTFERAVYLFGEELQNRR